MSFFGGLRKSKTVKKIAKIAAIAVATYYTGGAALTAYLRAQQPSAEAPQGPQYYGTVPSSYSAPYNPGYSYAAPGDYSGGGGGGAMPLMQGDSSAPSGFSLTPMMAMSALAVLVLGFLLLRK